MAIQGLNSQRPAVQTLQTTQPTPFAQRKEGPQSNPLEALTKALEALEQAVKSLSSNKSFNNGQSVAQQAGQNLGTSGGSQAPQFDWNSLFGGGSSFEQQAAPTPPAQQTARQDTSFLNGTGGGPAGTTTRHDNGLHLGNEKSGGGGSGIRIGSDGANN